LQNSLLLPMIPTITLPSNVSVRDTAQACRDALEEFARMEPNRFALANWLCHAYRRALVSPRDETPFVLRTPSSVEAVIREAQEAVAALRARAKAGADIAAVLPPRVHIVRVRDESGRIGFGPLDVRGTPLAARVISLFLADYLARGEELAA
jgi:hypothetical protein